MVQNSALCEITAMVPATKIRACFGFCDIHNFIDAMECLQEDVMMFVNKITNVVHNKVVLHQGFPNKNIGDAFLIVEEDCSRQYQQGTEYIPKLQYPKLLEMVQVGL
jgi:class 3 adenylate cyclase